MIKLELDENDLRILNDALIEMPFKVAAPLINKINQQIANEQTDK